MASRYVVEPDVAAGPIRATPHRGRWVAAPIAAAYDVRLLHNLSRGGAGAGRFSA